MLGNCNFVVLSIMLINLHRKSLELTLFFYLTKAKKRYIITLLSSAGDRGREWGEYYFYFGKRKRRGRVSGVHSGRKTETSWKKLFKKGLTKRKESDIILKLSRKRERHRKKLLKKTWKKYLTNGFECDIILKLLARATETASWKLNNIRKSITTLEIPLL